MASTPHLPPAHLRWHASHHHRHVQRLAYLDFSRRSRHGRRRSASRLRSSPSIPRSIPRRSRLGHPYHVRRRRQPLTSGGLSVSRSRRGSHRKPSSSVTATTTALHGNLHRPARRQRPHHLGIDRRQLGHLDLPTITVVPGAVLPVAIGRVDPVPPALFPAIPRPSRSHQGPETQPGKPPAVRP